MLPRPRLFGDCLQFIAIVLATVNMHTKFKVSSFIHSKDGKGPKVYQTAELGRRFAIGRQQCHYSISHIL